MVCGMRRTFPNIGESTGACDPACLQRLSVDGSSLENRQIGSLQFKPSLLASSSIDSCYTAQSIARQCGRLQKVGT